MSQDHALLIFIVLTCVLAAAVGAYIGIVRARAPLNAPESDAIRQRRLRFKDAHSGQARTAVFVAGALWLVSAALLIAASI
jgi:hypothetical protein